MASVFLGDLDDFITPSQACVNPIFNQPQNVNPTSSKGPAVISLALEDDFPPPSNSGRSTNMLDLDFVQILPKKPDLIHKQTTASGTIAQVSLNDCLACRSIIILLIATYIFYVSGCVTSTETVLLSQQGLGEFYSQIQRPDISLLIAIVSPQTVASIASYMNISIQHCGELITRCLYSIGIHAVYNSSLGHDITMLESAEEFLSRFV